MAGAGCDYFKTDVGIFGAAILDVDAEGVPGSLWSSAVPPGEERQTHTVLARGPAVHMGALYLLTDAELTGKKKAKRNAS